MENVRKAIQETTRLFAVRPTGFWSKNLIEGSTSLKTPNDWCHYYAWLGNPTTYDETKNYAPGTEEPVFNLPPELEVVSYNNGPQETIIHVRKIIEDCDAKSDDEKVAF